jgi:cyclopropane-fatty-acyl-phospholipid synthase
VDAVAVGPATPGYPKRLPSQWADKVAMALVSRLVSYWTRGEVLLVCAHGNFAEGRRSGRARSGRARSGRARSGHARAPALRRPQPPKVNWPERRVAVTVHEPAAYQAVLLEGSSGLARSYCLGWWDCDDLEGLMQISASHLPRPGSLVSYLTSLPGWARSACKAKRRTKRAGQRQQVMAHYDLGDDFFAAFLDPTMTYSCGIFEREDSSLQEASQAKIRHACELLSLGEGQSLLEIGTGWGSLALYAASTYGCHVTTTTVSASQLARARKRVNEAGLQGSITVLGLDYRELQGCYDKLVSVEMVEALSWRELDTFFRHCARLLAPGGQMLLQAIVIDDHAYPLAKRKRDFVKEIVFPGSNIPSLAALKRSAHNAGLEVAGYERIGQHYVRTLEHWRDNLCRNRNSLEELGYPKELVRLWELYLAYCRAGFAVGHLDDVQMLLAKPTIGSSRLSTSCAKTAP